MAEKKVILEVAVKMDDALKELAAYQQRVGEINEKMAELKRRSKEEKDESGALRAELTRLGEERKAYNKLIADGSRQIQNRITAEQTYKGAIKGLTAELSNAKEELRGMQMTDPGFNKKTKEVDDLNQQVKDLEASYGVHTRNVGNYEGAVSTLRSEIKELVAAIQEMERTGQTGSEAYARATDELIGKQEQLREETTDVSDSMSGLARGSEQLEGVTMATTAAIAGLGVLKNFFDDGTEEGQKYADMMQKLQIAVSALTIARQLAEAVRKSSIISMRAENIQVKALIASTKLETAAKSKNIVVSKAAAAAQWLLNKAMAANPVILAAAAIASLVAGLIALVSWLSKSAKVQREAAAAQREYEQAARRTEQTLAELESKALEREVSTRKRYQDELKQMMAAGASKEAITRKEQEMQDELTAQTVQDTSTRIEAEKAALAAAQANAEEQRKAYTELKRLKGEDSKKTQEQLKVAQDAAAEVIRLQNTVLNSTKEASDAVYQLVKADYDRRADATDKYYNRLQKRLENYHSLQKKRLELSSIYLYDYTKTAEENAEARFVAEQKYALESFALEQKQAREKLKAQRLSGVERREAEANLRKQQLQEQAVFAAQQLVALEEHQREMLRAAIDLAGGKDLDGQIADMRAQYAAAAKAIKEDTTMAADERSFYLRKLSMREAEEIKQLRQSANEETNKKILEQTEELYRNDLRQFSESAVEQVQLEIDKQKQIIAARKAAGLDTRAEEQQLAKSEAALRGAQLDRDLQLAWRDAGEQYRIKREYLEKELEAAGLSAERRAALEEELTNLTIENNQRKIASVEQWASAAMNLASEVSNLMSALGDAEVQKAEKKNDQEKKALDKRLKAGVISQKDYDKQVAALDADLDAKKAKIAREQAKREKVMSIFQIGLNTAVAIMKIWAEVPKADFGASTIAMTALVSAIGALQLAAAVATPLPMARKGGRIEGATHEQGGVLVNTENEERIISSAPAKAFPELLNLISYIGKHGGGIPETGYAARMMAAERSAPAQPGAPEIDYDRLAAAVGDRVAEGLRDMKIYLSLTELHDAEKEYARIENSAKM